MNKEKKPNYAMSALLNLLCGLLWGICAIFNFIDKDMFMGIIYVVLCVLFIIFSIRDIMKVKENKEG